MTIKWKLGYLIGKGAYGQVYQGLNIETGELIAIKAIQFGGEKETIIRQIEMIKQEIQLLKGFDHPNVIKYLQTEIFPDKRGAYLLLEYMPGGSLRNLLEKFGYFDERLARIYMRQIVAGLQYLHQQKIIHRDLKCANILVTSEGQVKLSDFGASKQLRELPLSELSVNAFGIQDQYQCKSIQGSPYWMAPEVARRESYSFSADVWSLGCLLIEMLCGNPPWSTFSKDSKTIIKLLIHTNEPPEFPDNISSEVKSFLQMCLQINQSERPNINMLCEHPFIKNDTSKVKQAKTKNNVEKELQDLILNCLQVDFGSLRESQLSQYQSALSSYSVVNEVDKIEERRRLEELILQEVQKLSDDSNRV